MDYFRRIPGGGYPDTHQQGSTRKKNGQKKPLREPPLRGNQPMPLTGAARYERRSKIFALLF